MSSFLSSSLTHSQVFAPQHAHRRNATNISKLENPLQLLRALLQSAERFCHSLTICSHSGNAHNFAVELQSIHKSGLANTVQAKQQHVQFLGPSQHRGLGQLALQASLPLQHHMLNVHFFPLFSHCVRARNPPSPSQSQTNLAPNLVVAADTEKTNKQISKQEKKKKKKKKKKNL